jgi:hypothetical protein
MFDVGYVMVAASIRIKTFWRKADAVIVMMHTP